MAKVKAKRSRRPSVDRLAAVAALLPPEALKEIRDNLAKPKRPVGRAHESLEGRRFGEWRVGPRSDKAGRVAYSCLCSCMNVAIVDAQNLLRGQSTRCRACANKGVARNLPRVKAARNKA